MLHRLSYYLKRLKTLGFQQSSARALAHLTSRWWHHYWRIRARYNFFPATKISDDTDLIGNTTHLTYFLKSPLYQSTLPHDITAYTAAICSGTVEIFGTQINLHDPLVWHRDPRVPASCPWYDPAQPTFSLDIKPCTGTSEQADIKFPWELSRLQHLTALGFAYQKTTSAPEKTLLVDALVEQITSWRTANPFMKGVNWTNTMEVAIRATNLIYIFHFFKDAPAVPSSFWHEFIALLQQHQWYIQTQWETSATPNNHYLADLIGYLHLLLFFSAPPQRIATWIMRCKRAFDHQILNDGWAYEGSTAYHQLDTEMILHLRLIAEHCNSPQLNKIMLLHEKMAAVRAHMITKNKQLITIGDDDSGKLVTGLRAEPSLEKSAIYSFTEAGLTVIKRDELHLTMRHAIYHKAFPSGHYHRDDLSFTLAVEGYQIIIDPGSYAYTGNPTARRAFRSWESHSTVFCVDELPDHNELFQLNKQEFFIQPRVVASTKMIEIVSKRPLYCTSGTCTRTLTIADRSIKIDDSITDQIQHDVTQTLIFAPDVTLESKDKTWLIHHPSGVHGTLTSTHQWILEEWWTATGYGKSVPCKRLRTIPFKKASGQSNPEVLSFHLEF